MLHPQLNKYTDPCFSHSLNRLFAEPTRTTESTKTLIDHILTNSEETVVEISVIEIGLSDHGIIFL